jgi:lipopolysaccharide export system ATP-binding protein
MSDNQIFSKQNIPETEISGDVLSAIITSTLTKYTAENETEPSINIEITNKVTKEIVSEVIGEKSPPPKLEEHTLGVSNLYKSFGKKLVVKGVNFTMKNGEVAGLLGPNGAGKTTIFYMIVGFYQPTLGYVTMDDIDITSKPMYRRARMGIAYLPQEASIFRKLTVEQNI